MRFATNAKYEPLKAIDLTSHMVKLEKKSWLRDIFD